jgi:hypothetical protein
MPKVWQPSVCEIVFFLHLTTKAVLDRVSELTSSLRPCSCCSGKAIHGVSYLGSAAPRKKIMYTWILQVSIPKKYNMFGRYEGLGRCTIFVRNANSFEQAMIRPLSVPHIFKSSGLALTLPFFAAAAYRCILS